MSLTRYLISTQSYRHEYDQNEEIPTQYGYLVETDFADHQRLLRIETSTQTPHDERIKTGLRGLAIWGDGIYVASWNAVHRISKTDFEFQEKVSHPLMADLHGIHVDAEHIWVTSSLIDSLLKFDHDFNLLGVLTLTDTHLYPRKLREKIDLDKDYRLRGKEFSGFKHFHANHVADLDSRSILLTGRGRGPGNGRVLKVDRETLNFRVWLKGLHGPHDGLFIRDDLFSTTETDGASIALVKATGFWGPRIQRRLSLPQDDGKFWTRGLAVSPDETLLVGRSVWKGDKRSASVLEMDLQGEVLKKSELDLPDYPECRIFQILRVT